MIDYLELGGTLFIPATYKGLEVIVNERKYPNLRSVVIDTEDSLNDAEIGEALKNIQQTLKALEKNELYLFMRPRSLTLLKEFLSYENIDKVDGFVLPKFSLENAKEYFHVLENTHFMIMPSIEGSELFDTQKLKELREIILLHKQKVVLIRFGLEDMLKQLQMRRTCEDSIFDFSVTSTVLGNFIAIFKSAGFAISGGVYPCFEDDEGFKKDLLRDLKEGLFTKTIIHPRQIELVDEMYKVDKNAFDEAEELVNASKQVFSQSGKMAEKSTMFPVSQFIVKRAKIYGLR